MGFIKLGSRSPWFNGEMTAQAPLSFRHQNRSVRETIHMLWPWRKAVLGAHSQPAGFGIRPLEAWESTCLCCRLLSESSLLTWCGDCCWSCSCSPGLAFGVQPLCSFWLVQLMPIPPCGLNTFPAWAVPTAEGIDAGEEVGRSNSPHCACRAVGNYLHYQI